MEQISLNDYLLSSENNQELIMRLLELDLFIKYLHQSKKMYVFSFDPDGITIYDNRLSMQSFHDKLNYLNEYYKGMKDYDKDGGLKNDMDAITDDIEEVCAVGICAFNKIKISASKEMRNYLKVNLSLYNANNRIPEEIYEYYEDVLINGNYGYLSDFLKKVVEEKSSNQSNKTSARIYTYSSAIGRAFSEHDDKAAFISVLIIPGIMVLIYMVIIVVAMIF